jgi:hypothetical protein
LLSFPGHRAAHPRPEFVNAGFVSTSYASALAL